MLRHLAIALVLAVTAPVAAHCQQLPPLPDSVETPIGYVRVVRVAKPCDVPYAYGCFASAQRIIFVRDSLAPIMMWKVYLHEVWHVRLFDAYIRISEPGLEDRIVDLAASYTLAGMLAERRRPMK